MKKFYFIRHGQTDYNKQRIVQGSGIDSHLNETGRNQARLFYNHYQNTHFDYIICSSLTRSFQTIEPFVDDRKLSFERTHLINEISWGVHEGKKGTLEMKMNYEKMVDEWSKGNFDAALEEAESARQLSDRLQQFLDYLVTLPYKDVLICTHGRSLRCLLCLMKNEHLKQMEQYSHFNTGLFIAHYSAGKFDFVEENNVEHLRYMKNAPDREWG